MTSKLAFLILSLYFLQATHASECVSENPICIDFAHFQNCVNTSTGYQPAGNPILCEKGHICDDSSGLAVCQNLNLAAFALQPLSGDTPEPVPQCSGSGKYATNVCDKYYECVPFLIFWWTPELKTCPDGQYFDNSTSSCRPVEEVNCGTTVPNTATTTTTVAPVNVPNCQGPTKHPGLFCYQYFECVQKLWWFEPRLKTCPNGQAFHVAKGECDCAGAVRCVLPQTSPKCDGAGTLPAVSCNQYYQCKQKLWWWETTLTDCPSGQNYDVSTCKCTSDSTVICTTREPTCYGYAKYPAAKNNQYYECTLSSTGLEWTPVLKTCYVGYVFNVDQLACVRG